MIPGERIPGKFSHQRCEWASAQPQCALVTQTSEGITRGWGEGSR